MKIYRYPMTLLLLAGCATHVAPRPEVEVVVATKVQGPQSTPLPTAPQPDRCVVIDAPSESAGLLAERGWLHDHYPGWKNAFVHGLSVSGDPANRRYFDRDQIFTAEGDRVTVCFDITAFFGKF